jgi:hypothetical protein
MEPSQTIPVKPAVSLSVEYVYSHPFEGGRAANSLPTLSVLDRPAAGLSSFHNSKRVIARRNATDANLHELRKKVKDLV